jgi:hypothetical protein
MPKVVTDMAGRGDPGVGSRLGRAFGLPQPLQLLLEIAALRRIV